MVERGLGREARPRPAVLPLLLPKPRSPAAAPARTQACGGQEDSPEGGGPRESATLSVLPDRGWDELRGVKGRVGLSTELTAFCRRGLG